MPGLLRGVVRTAVIAGTASAVSGRIQRRQAEHFAERDARIMAIRETSYRRDVGSATRPPAQQPAQRSAQQPAQPARSTAEMIEQLKALGELKAQGILTDEEFSLQKARILD